MWLRAVAVWGLILVVEALNGTLRLLYLVPRLGDLPSRQVGVFIGALLIIAIAWLTVRWIEAPSRRAWLGVGLLWVMSMVGAEIVLGRWAFGYPWSRIGEDFDPARGGLLGFGMLVLLLAPWAMARARGLAGAVR